MTLSDAIENPGVRVIYTHPATGAQEPGVISHATHERGLVFVYYGDSVIATHPANLKFDRSRR
ncbi:hypothetical protein AXA44_02770 [Rhodococcus sp. SC4]|nr:hypothetical protein AXA44_02770 [Rhodococcus sp. SC4]